MAFEVEIVRIARAGSVNELVERTLFPSCLLRATVSAQPGFLAGGSALFMLEFIKVERMMDARSARTNTKTNSDASKLRIPSVVLESMIDAITGAVPTDSIYIFGSYARREERPSSDVDIMVVTENDDERPIRYATTASTSISRLMYDAGLDYDLLARFRDDYQDRKTRRTTVDYAIANEGVKIYG